MQKIRASFLSVLVILTLTIIITSHYQKLRNQNNVIINDIAEYYGYLTATFIYHDLNLKIIDRPNTDHHLWAKTKSGENYIFKMSMGMSMLYAPFFIGAHIYALLFKFPPNGYSDPYQLALLISALCFLVIGLCYLRKILNLYFSDSITAIVILLIGIGTNLFYYATIAGPHSHVYNFCLFAIFIYNSIIWYRKPTYKTSLVLGLVLGLISLIRPTNGLVVMFFVLYDVKNIKDLTARIKYLISHYRHFIIIGVLVFLVWFPQLLYWKRIAGEWLYYSYGDEKILWNHPNILNGLISFRKGWLLYTPLMLFAFAGLYLSFRRLKPFFFPVLIFTTVYIWVTFSWWCWWYGGSFGQRSMIDVFPLMAVMIAVFLQWLWQKKIWLKISLSLIILLTVFMSVFYTIQYRYGALHWDSMSKAAYFNNFGHMEPYGQYWSLVICPDNEKAKTGIQDTVPRH